MALLLILTLAGYHQELGLSLALMWLLLLAGPPLAYLLSVRAVRRLWGASRDGRRVP